MIAKIQKLVARKALPIATLCERLDVSRADLLAEVKEAQGAGSLLRVADGYIGARVPVGPHETPEVGRKTPGRYHVAHVTDLHAGSRFHDRKALQGFLRMAWDKGVRIIANTGDNLDGVKDVLTLEQRATGFDAQSAELVETVRKAPPFRWIALDGNHDGYLSNSSGFVSGLLLQHRMREAGVKWVFAGVCLGRAIIHGARWYLWHPHGGASTRNAIRRILNEKAEALDEPCDILAMGHFHKYATVAVHPEHVFGIAGGTFQRKGSEFANRICRPWDVGASIVSYDLDARGRVSHVSAEFYPC